MAKKSPRFKVPYTELKVTAGTSAEDLFSQAGQCLDSAAAIVTDAADTCEDEMRKRLYGAERLIALAQGLLSTGAARHG